MKTKLPEAITTIAEAELVRAEKHRDAKKNSQPGTPKMKKIEVAGTAYWYNSVVGQLFYDKKGSKQCPVFIFNPADYVSFLEQIKN